jgi:hypothetical protein
MRSIVPKLAVIGTTMATALFWSTPAQAHAWACGATVSGTVNLNHDLHCHGDGLVLLNGSLNLHGHTIHGDGTGTGVAVAGETGAADVAAITNGTITGFVVDVEHLGSDNLRLNLSKLEVSGTSDAAIRSQPNTVGTFDNLRVTDNARFGLDQSFGGHLVMAHSVVDHNGLGFALNSDASIDLVKTTIRNNDSAINCSEGRIGLKASEVSHNGSGISMFLCEGSVLDESSFIGNGMAASEEVAGFPGIAEPTLTVTNDVFQDNVIGLHLTPLATTTVVRDSVFRHNHSGIVMDVCGPFDACVPVNDELVGNVFTHNTHDGVRWGYGTVSLSRNHFNNNGGWGFIADPSAVVVDGGGNMADGNGAGDCKGLSCS